MPCKSKLPPAENLKLEEMCVELRFACEERNSSKLSNGVSFSWLLHPDKDSRVMTSKST